MTSALSILRALFLFFRDPKPRNVGIMVEDVFKREGTA